MLFWLRADLVINKNENKNKTKNKQTKTLILIKKINIIKNINKNIIFLQSSRIQEFDIKILNKKIEYVYFLRLKSLSGS